MSAQNSLKIFILYIHTWIILCFDKKLKSHIPEQFSPSARYFDDKVIFSTCLPPFHHILFGWRCASTSSSSWPQKTMWGNNLMRWRSHEVTILQCWTWWAAPVDPNSALPSVSAHCLTVSQANQALLLYSVGPNPTEFYPGSSCAWATGTFCPTCDNCSI